ncbi:EVE domain-containing protein [Pajaroellobacter abortibovis]|uniref:EVE domain-containing protein n=1 Tax=Pajaroellobacter abortibovis TaxID=1882918 RepID=A0A1L6MWA3_9BACT|nr:EVE domain-containing protein [Pajaroellobacter abortibovis]APR99833.1 hypothetical protein BCY86_03435 [Pajaroellobacter abortibovis]
MTEKQQVRYWSLKSEPSSYSFSQLIAEKKTTWEGVRNPEARYYLGQMQLGDLAFFYHSNQGKEIVGIARICRTAHADPTSPEKWIAVEVEPVMPLNQPVSLTLLKATPALDKMVLVRRSRLSVAPVTEEEFKIVLHLGNTQLIL